MRLIKHPMRRIIMLRSNLMSRSQIRYGSQILLISAHMRVGYIFSGCTGFILTASDWLVNTATHVK